MKRRQFIKTTLASGIALSVIPHFAFQEQTSSISYDHLIGKGNPILFGDGYKLQKDAYDSFSELKSAALKEGIHIQVVSSYRNYAHQNRIWERKFKRFTNNGLSPIQSIEKIIEYSTIPGTSRHHWGTDIDIIDTNVEQPNSVLQPRHFEKGGCFHKLKSWMDDNSKNFGFHLVYTNNPDRKGFKYEPWHYSFKPISQNYLKQYLKLDIETIISEEKLLGHQYFSKQFISKYLNQNILDINPELL
ncbi:M15 family metallopeptidase [Psychroserpens sp. XS_ASV72]|uniref:M15 family metallopeptidase n=1 Tax=Psychroserpens sp. XS_ASV72 TaxID=3241293 RepID=UPI003514384B